jgi:hypothetical protein
VLLLGKRDVVEGRRRSLTVGVAVTAAVSLQQREQPIVMNDGQERGRTALDSVACGPFMAELLRFMVQARDMSAVRATVTERAKV